MILLFRRVSFLCGFGIIAVGLVTMGGWLLGERAFAAWLPHGPAMKFNSAVIFVAAGLSLILQHGDQAPPWQRRLGRLLALFIGALGFLTLIQHHFGLDLGLDRLFYANVNRFAEPHPVSWATHPGRFSPIGGWLSLLMSTALLNLDRPAHQGERRAQYCALGVGVVGTVALLAYVFQVEEFFSLSLYTRLALPGAVALVLFSTGTLLSRPGSGLVAILVSTRSGGLLARRLLATSSIAILTVGWLSFTGLQAGLYNASYGFAAFLTASLFVILFLVWKHAVTMDALDRKRSAAEDSLRHTEESYKFLAKAGAELALSIDYRATTARIVNLGAAALGKHGHCFLFEEVRPGGPLSLCASSCGAREANPQALTVTSQQSLEEWLLRKETTRGSAVFPLSARDGALRIAVFLAEDRALGPLDLLLADELSRRFALALDNALLYEASQRMRKLAEQAAERTGRLQTLTAALSRAATLDEVIQSALNGGLAHLGAERAMITVLDPDTDRYRIAGAVGLPESVLATVEQALNEIPSLPIPHAIKHGESVFLDRFADWGRDHPETARFIQDVGSVSFACVPIFLGKQAIGAMNISFRVPHHFSEEDCAFMKAVVQQCGQALERSRLYEETRKALLAREEFLSIASHELKTPITALDLQLAMLARHAKPADSRSPLSTYVDKCLKQSRKLTSLIDELLDVTRIHAGRMALRIEETDLAAICHEMPGKFSDELARSGSPLRIHAPRHVIGFWDPSRMEQIVSNLVSNAIKYGQGREIEVTLRCPASDERDEQVMLQVRDHGMGIPKDHQERIFGRFERVVSYRHISGLGLGLYIVKQLVDAHGGTITVRSEEHQGAVFSVRLPLKTNALAS